MRDFELISALISPFNQEGKVDYTALKLLINNQIENKITSFVLFGTTGEGSTIPLKEKVKIIKKIRKDYGQKIKLMIGISEVSTLKAIKSVKIISSLNVDSLLVLSPFYLKTNETGILTHFQMIADASYVPIYLYYIPKRTGQVFSSTLYRILKQHTNIYGLKEASSSLKNFHQSLSYQSSNFKVYLGDDLYLFDALENGAAGLISVVSNIYPKTLKKIIDYYQEGKVEEAKNLYSKFEKIFTLMFEEPNPIPVKYLLKNKGLTNIYYHLPLVLPSQELKEKLDRYYQEDNVCELY